VGAKDGQDVLVESGSKIGNVRRAAIGFARKPIFSEFTKLWYLGRLNVFAARCPVFCFG
jgi:hypothetical protein